MVTMGSKDISKILKRIKRFSHKFNAIKTLSDKIWIVINDSDQSTHYVFFPDGRVYFLNDYTNKHQSTIGSWAWLANDKVFAIEQFKRVTYFHPVYVDNSFLAFRHDSNNEIVLLIDVKETLPELDVKIDSKVNQYLAAKEEKLLNELKQGNIKGFNSYYFKRLIFLVSLSFCFVTCALSIINLFSKSLVIKYQYVLLIILSVFIICLFVFTVLKDCALYKEVIQEYFTNKKSQSIE